MKVVIYCNSKPSGGCPQKQHLSNRKPWGRGFAMQRYPRIPFVFVGCRCKWLLSRHCTGSTVLDQSLTWFVWWCMSICLLRSMMCFCRFGSQTVGEISWPTVCHWFSLVVICFHWFQEDLKPSRPEGWGSLWRQILVSYPFKMMHSSKLHSTVYVDGNRQDDVFIDFRWIWSHPGQKVGAACGGEFRI